MFLLSTLTGKTGLFTDVDAIYDWLKERYGEQHVMKEGDAYWVTQSGVPGFLAKQRYTFEWIEVIV